MSLSQGRNVILSSFQMTTVTGVICHVMLKLAWEQAVQPAGPGLLSATCACIAHVANKSTSQMATFYRTLLRDLRLLRNLRIPMLSQSTTQLPDLTTCMLLILIAIDEIINQYNQYTSGRLDLCTVVISPEL